MVAEVTTGGGGAFRRPDLGAVVNHQAENPREIRDLVIDTEDGRLV